MSISEKSGQSGQSGQSRQTDRTFASIYSATPSAATSYTSSFADEQNPIYDSDEDECETFDPLPYKFTLKDAYGLPINLSPEMVQNVQGICPPFHTLLDHLIAVLWIFYSQYDLEKLTATNIHWALKFLEGMKTRDGYYSPDIEIIIEHLQQALIEMTANIDEESPDEKKLEQTPKSDSPGPDNDDGGVEFAKESPEIEKLPISFILEDLTFNLEDFESMLQAGDDGNQIESDVSLGKIKQELESPKNKVSKKLFVATDDETLGLTEELMQWRNDKMQKMIKQLEQIQHFDEQLRNANNLDPETVEKMKAMVDEL